MDGELFPTDIERGAAISACGKYRWSLTRTWDRQKPALGWIMLNPSTADADVDDPTIRRCMGFARKWGFGGIIVINLFPFRATDPSELKTASNVHGVAGDVANYTICLDLVTCCPQICVAWGSLTWDVAKDIARAFLRNFVARQIVPVCLGLTADKWPRHPLYVRGDTQPIPYTEFPGGAA